MGISRGGGGENDSRGVDEGVDAGGGTGVGGRQLTRQLSWFGSVGDE